MGRQEEEGGLEFEDNLKIRQDVDVGKQTRGKLVAL